ncbi:MAG: 50S ribosomal protein L7/L12 [Mastigocoleus sp.]
MSDKIVSILEELKTLNLTETSHLVKQIEDTFKVNASLNPLIQQSFIDDSGYFSIIEDELDTELSVVLEEVPTTKKIEVLKAIRNLTSLGLKEAKEIVDSVPKTIFSGIPRNEAEDIKKQLESVGGKISLQ